MKDSVIVSNYIIAMRVGLTENERASPQRIQIDVEIETDFTDVVANGDLACGVNYSCARKHVKEIALGQVFVLLETFGHCIAQKLLEDPKAIGVKVRIQKLDRWDDAIPGIQMYRHR